MIYSRLSIEELERWTYAKPDDTEAKAELLRRTGELLDDKDQRFTDLEAEMDSVREDADYYDSKRHEAEEEAAALATKLEAAEARIAELTSPEGLV